MIGRQHDKVLERGRELIANLLANPDSFSGSGYNDLLSFFYKGLPIEILGDLLRHPNQHVIAGALFIAEELGKKATSLVREIVAHIDDKNPHIRVCALDALTGAISSANEHAFIHVVRGVQDSDPRCRKMAMLWMMRVNDTRLKAALESLESVVSDEEIREGLHMLLGESGRESTQIQKWILDENPLIRKFGAIAAGRVADLYPHLLELAAQSEDTDIRTSAIVQARFTLRQKPGNSQMP